MGNGTKSGASGCDVTLANSGMVRYQTILINVDEVMRHSDESIVSVGWVQKKGIICCNSKCESIINWPGAKQNAHTIIFTYFRV